MARTIEQQPQDFQSFKKGTTQKREIDDEFIAEVKREMAVVNKRAFGAHGRYSIDEGYKLRRDGKTVRMGYYYGWDYPLDLPDVSGGPEDWIIYNGYYMHKDDLRVLFPDVIPWDKIEPAFPPNIFQRIYNRLIKCVSCSS